MEIRKSLGLSGDFRGVTDSLIRVGSATEVIAMRGAAKTALAVSTGIAKNGDPSGELLVKDLDEKADGTSSAKPTLSRAFARNRNENAFKKAAAQCVPV